MVEDDSPSGVLRWLSRLAGQLVPPAFATATVVVEPHTGYARIASAGHPVCHLPAEGSALCCRLSRAHRWAPSRS